MYTAPKSMSAPAANPILYWPREDILLNGGLNLVDKEWKLDDNQTPKVLNMWWKNGELGKRWGQDWLKSDEAPEPIAYTSYRFPFKGHIIKHCGTKLYKQDINTGVLTSIYTVNASKGVFFKFNGKLYYKQSGKYVVIDDTLTASDVVPYAPTVIINRTPTGGGNTNEQYNRAGKAFKNSFNGTGSATAYTLTDTNLDATAVTVTVGGVTKVEGTDFTVNRTTGVVTFNVAPAAGTNNVIITAYKTNQADLDAIFNSVYVMPFGGQNDNRVFIGGGNGGYYYWTGITAAGVDPTYFAYNNYNIIGLTDEAITGFGKHYDTLTIHKESGEIYGITYTWNGTIGIFNTFPINSQYGCDCPDTMQNINNALVWVNSKFGACILLGTNVGSQRNAFPISRNVNPWLLKESNLKNASSVDFDGKYWLCVNDKVYPWDYFISPYVDTGNPDVSAKALSWWYFDNINAQSFITDAGNLYYTDRVTGKTVKFHVTDDGGQFYDFGVEIQSVYRLPLRDLGGGIYEFDVIDMWVDASGDSRTDIDILYFTNDEISGEAEAEPITVGSFNLKNFSLHNFTLGVMGLKKTFALKPLEKKIDLFGVEFHNSDAGRDMNISNLKLSYRLGKRK
jgi:hypothetical protein